VVFAGEVSEEDLPLYYAAGDVFVLPTHPVPQKGFVEGFGIVFIEAASSGLPVVAGRAGGSPDAVADGVSGFLVDAGCDEDLQERVVSLLEDPVLQGRMGTAGRRRVETDFTWETKRGQFRNILAELGSET
jgi:phosphatidylinositol alpha-1,6-mannosyltransferase